jgi:hypothetical protein
MSNLRPLTWLLWAAGLWVFAWATLHNVGATTGGQFTLGQYVVTLGFTKGPLSTISLIALGFSGLTLILGHDGFNIMTDPGGGPPFWNPPPKYNYSLFVLAWAVTFVVVLAVDFAPQTVIQLHLWG